MPIGKDSIQKRVAKTAEATEPAAEKKVTKAAEETAAKEPAATTEPKSAPRKRTTAKPKAASTPADKPAETATAVMGNVSPEVVEKVTGHKENSGVQHIGITDELPTYLL